MIKKLQRQKMNDVKPKIKIMYCCSKTNDAKTTNIKKLQKKQEMRKDTQRKYNKT